MCAIGQQTTTTIKMNEKFGFVFVSDAANLVEVPLAIHSKANAEYLATLSVT